MPYYDHYALADDMIAHLNTVMGSISNPFIESRYVGFVAIAATTVYELAIKDIFYEFALQKHIVLETFTRSHFERLNGRIKFQTIRDEHCKKFGDKYVNRFKAKSDKLEQDWLETRRISVRSSYNNVIAWRHQFAHVGVIPSTVTYSEITQSYTVGKEIIRCLAESMYR